MPTVQNFRDYIRRTKLKAADQGVTVLRLDSEGIHVCVAGPSRGVSEMAACHEAMKAEIGPNDQIVTSIESRKHNLTIDYQV